MNALRWTTPAGDHRSISPPSEIQQKPPMAGVNWDVVADRDFSASGFTEAYLGGAAYHGVWHPSTLVSTTRLLLDSGRPRVFAYYDGLDHIAHTYGFRGEHFDMELSFCDWLVGEMISMLPSGSALVVMADHGQIEAPELVKLSPDCDALCRGRSGEPRFRWLHARKGAKDELYEAALGSHGDIAWVRTKEQVIDEQWFGPEVTSAAARRLGDVCLVPFEAIGVDDPGEPYAHRLIGRHGGLTLPEMMVPILHAMV